LILKTHPVTFRFSSFNKALKICARKMLVCALAKNKTLFERSEFVLLRVGATFFSANFQSLELFGTFCFKTKST